jgi:hypothetical protein
MKGARVHYRGNMCSCTHSQALLKAEIVSTYFSKVLTANIAPSTSAAKIQTSCW